MREPQIVLRGVVVLLFLHRYPHRRPLLLAPLHGDAVGCRCSPMPSYLAMRFQAAGPPIASPIPAMSPLLPLAMVAREALQLLLTLAALSLRIPP